MPDGLERAGDNQVRGVDRVHRVGNGVDHLPIRLRANRVEVEAEVRLVPDLEHVLLR